MTESRLTGTRIDHVVLRVRDVERAAAFYSRFLGAEREGDLAERGFLSMRLGDALIDLAPSNEPGSLGSHGVAHICVAVSGCDPEETRAFLEAEGVLVEHEVSQTRLGAEGAGPSLYVTDPDGYRIELKWYPQ